MHLVIDLANQVILPLIKNETIESWIFRVTKRIKFVLAIARRWKLSPIFVCDAGYTTEEVQQKWRFRREKELERSIRKIPYCADTIICEIILKYNLPLVFDKRYNADDIVATIANMHPKSIILSRDMDYFRYDNLTLKYRIYYIGEKRQLTQLAAKGSMRDPLETIRMYFPIFASSHTDFVKIVRQGLYMRGTAYPLGEKELGKSLHLATRKYRQLLYTDIVREIFPIWNNGVAWVDDFVKPCKGILPDNSQSIVNNIIEEVGYINYQHKLTIIIMACELLSIIKSVPLLEELQQFHII